VLSIYNLPFWGLMTLSFVFLALHLLGSGPEGPELELPGTAELPDLPETSIFSGILPFGQIPLSLVLMSATFFWGSLGLLANTFWQNNTGSYPGWAFLLVLLGSLPPALLITRGVAKGLGKLFRENTAATSPEDLLGCLGQVISAELPASEQPGFGRVRVYSAHGTLLQLPCITHPDCEPPQRGQQVFVTGYDPEQRLYTVLTYESPDYLAWLHGHAGEMQRFEARLKRSLAFQQQAEPQSEPSGSTLHKELETP